MQGFWSVCGQRTEQLPQSYHEPISVTAVWLFPLCPSTACLNKMVGHWASTRLARRASGSRRTPGVEHKTEMVNSTVAVLRFGFWFTLVTRIRVRTGVA